jgi:hypothetical protein
MSNCQQPLVSVICLCYNQSAYVARTLQSVFEQTYANIELIVVDDGSSDSSVQVIKATLTSTPVHISTELIVLEHNKGNCTAFNIGLKRAKGKYTIDLAADDVLLPERIVRQVAVFETLPEKYAVLYGNARYIDAQDHILGHHYKIAPQGNALKAPPSGDIYEAVLRGYFICTPTMMMRTSVLQQLGGYNEALSYEDFDFWVRSARVYYYHYQDEILTHKRRLPRSHGSGFYQKNHNPHLVSTWQVCRSALALNTNNTEHEALACSIRYYMRQCWYTHNFQLGIAFASLLKAMPVKFTLVDSIFYYACRWHLPINLIYTLYLRIRQL